MQTIHKMSVALIYRRFCTPSCLKYDDAYIQFNGDSLLINDIVNMKLRYEKSGLVVEGFDFYQPVAKIMDAVVQIGFIMLLIG